MTPTVLLVGATGMLGGRIAHYLLGRPEARTRLLVRIGTGKPDTLKQFAARGAEVIEGDLADLASLDRATEGVDVIVFAVQGGPDVIVDGQVALAEAGKRNGVRRILPSDFALDLLELGAAMVAAPGTRVRFAYQLYMTNGQTSPSDLQNGR